MNQKTIFLFLFLLFMFIVISAIPVCPDCEKSCIFVDISTQDFPNNMQDLVLIINFKTSGNEAFSILNEVMERAKEFRLYYRDSQSTESFSYISIKPQNLPWKIKVTEGEKYIFRIFVILKNGKGCLFTRSFSVIPGKKDLTKKTKHQLEV